ncbi:MAG TPA: glycoside hydrolase family 30 beta sandwich domain-containing protein [Mucilaginibacter sp.]|jgi:glucosylceramidase|nr:glycoside hydrolase family 30 beta sandwich domain-containing protein [Mucilaginibacter sp.]
MCKCKQLTIVLLLVLGLQATNADGQKETSNPQVWLTDPDQGILFKQQNQISKPNSTDKNISFITVDKAKTYQQMDGFGFALTGGSAMLIHKMSPVEQHRLLTELFGTGESEIGTSYLRVSIGSSDLDDHVFSYDDLAAGEPDTNLKKFTLANDEGALIPVLKKILAINPHIKILASPWSPPAWMKTNNNTSGGHLKPEYYHAYSQYLVKYIKGMAAKGIRIDAITIQNEPLNPGNNPSMVMEAVEQANFIKHNLGPDFKAADIKTKIILYDHNADRSDYPISILDDPDAKKYVDGSAFHLYGGKIEALSKVHDAHPDKNLYFTEEWVGAPGNLKQDIRFHIKQIIVGAPRNWSRNVIEWNLASDPHQQPHTPGGCDRCLGAITINGDEVTRNPAYYIIAHASKFVSPGSKRVASNYFEELPNVAYITPAGKMVLIVFNDSGTGKTFNIQYEHKATTEILSAGAVGTFVF